MFEYECCGDCKHCNGNYCDVKDTSINPNSSTCSEFEERQKGDFNELFQIQKLCVGLLCM